MREWDLLEYSAVPIPENPGAVTVALEKGLVSDPDLVEWLSRIPTTEVADRGGPTPRPSRGTISKNCSCRNFHHITHRKKAGGVCGVAATVASGFRLRLAIDTRKPRGLARGTHKNS